VGWPYDGEGRLSTATVADRVGVAGRAPGCDCLVTDEFASRRHAEVWRGGERWILRDLGSRNGTRVNGIRAIEPVEVPPGDRVTLGGAPYRLSRPLTPRPRPR
jgi:pSer/pThr/pTyr-binding forkhead associated (FHA) protein